MPVDNSDLQEKKRGMLPAVSIWQSIFASMVRIILLLVPLAP